LAARRTIVGLVLAGGRSTRMGADKALVDFDGRPLIAHVVERLRPQVDALAISANGEPARFASFALPVLADDAEYREAGPLAGIAAALAYAQAESHAWLATAPCDAPLFPRDLVARLAEALATAGAAIAAAESPRGVEPLFALWRVDLRPALGAFLAAGGRSPRQFMTAQNAARVAFPASDAGDPFANLNSRAELEAARAALSRATD